MLWFTSNCVTPSPLIVFCCEQEEERTLMVALDRLDHDTTFLWLDAIVLAITVVNFAWTFHPSFVIVKPLLLSISMVLFVTMQM